ncbi:MAG: ketopantoate reductase family protein [Candidatus Nanopelagicales bacterium]
MRILVLGAGVIGSVYASKLLYAGHDVVMLARGQRLADLRACGLSLEDAGTGAQSTQHVPTISEMPPDVRFDLVLVPVRAEQLDGVLPVLTGMTDGSDVLFFANTGDRTRELVAALGGRALFGFPAAGGVRDGVTVRYVLISQQKTMVGDPDGTATARVRKWQHILIGAGFPTVVSADIGGWLAGHAAFVVPIALALYRVGVDTPRLAADPGTVRLMVLSTREAFSALHVLGKDEIPKNLRLLYRLPTPLVIAYWRRIFKSPRGELWFGAHTRAAPEEMHALAEYLHQRVLRAGRPTPNLDRLLATST